MFYIAIEYRKDLKDKNLQLTEGVLSTLPEFMSDFIRDNEVSKSDNTLLSYSRDIQSFFSYLVLHDERFLGKEIEFIAITDLEQLNALDIKAYERNLSKADGLTNTTIKRKLSSIASLYKYLVTYKGCSQNPLQNYQYPKSETHAITYLNSEQTKTLLDGVMSNSKKLVSQQTGKFTKDGTPITELVPIEMSHEEAIAKEKTVLRDVAIILLFLGTGLRISELVGIDLSDIDFDDNCVTVLRKGKGMSLEKVYFGQEVAQALKLYVDGMHLPMDIVQKYPESFLSYCTINAYKPDLLDLAVSDFARNDEEFIRDVEQICYIIRNFGRSNFNPKRGEDALFLSSRGKRISVRMVELIIKEKVLTYLPDMRDKEKISPHKLRSTAATRLLSQTDDIILVSKQLGHSSPAVTAKHYAQLQEEKEKVRLASLDVTDW